MYNLVYICIYMFQYFTLVYSQKYFYWFFSYFLLFFCFRFSYLFIVCLWFTRGMSYSFLVLVFAAVQNNLTYLYQIQLPGSAGVEVCVLYV